MTVPILTAVIALLLALGVACGDNDADASASPTAATATPAVTGSVSPTPTATATPTPTPPVEPTASTGALPIEALPVIEFQTADGSLVPLAVEIVPRDQYSIGLSGRYELGERGMVFYYDPPGHSSFYMRNTHFDLDIAFVGADLVIDEIHQMEAESLDLVRPAEVYQYAIEAPVGWYEANSIAAGDLLLLDFDVGEYRAE